MKFREHRGGLDESMRTCVELEPTLAALRAYLKAIGTQGGHQWFDGASATVHEYFPMPDERIGWPETFIVMVTWTIQGERGPIGYTDSMPIE